MDITAWFTQRAKALSPGRLVKDRHTSLFEVMNALEINDPQMDTGMTSPACLFDPSLALSPDDVISIMDEMSILECRWWQGATLCQTVYTSLAYHNIEILSTHPNPLVSVGLRAFSIGYAKCVDLAYNELCKSHISDGEDCWLDHYGLSVNMVDSVEAVSTLISHAIDQISHSELVQRLRTRMDLLLFLAQGRTLKLPYSLAPITPAAQTLFADVSGCLRQCMPLPPQGNVAREHVWLTVRQAFDDFERLADHRDEAEWRLELLGKAYSRQMLPLTRSLYRSFLGTDTDSFLHHWISRHTGADLNALDTLHHVVPQADRRQFAIWRDLVHGYYVSTLAVPLQNRPRQRRSYLSLSLAWYERACTAENFAPLHPLFTSLASHLYAARLDCLLEAAIAGWDLDLVSPGEDRLSWWWIERISRARSNIALAESWESTWARAWGYLAEGMQNLLPFAPITNEHFTLRFKWAIKASDDLASYVEWKASASPINEAHARECLSQAVSLLRFLAIHTRGDYKIVIQELLQDLATLKLQGTRRRWIPIA